MDNINLFKEYWKISSDLKAYFRQCGILRSEPDVETFLDIIKPIINQCIIEDRQQLIEFSNKELETVINTKTSEFPPMYSAGPANRPISMRRQLLMCEETAWRKVIDKLQSNNIIR